MANSKFEYVRSFEQPDQLLPNTWIVVRIDGRAFTKVCAKYDFQKPNDRRALDLMNVAAMAVVNDLPEIVVAYGVSDEYRCKTCSPQLDTHKLIISVSSFTNPATCLSDVQVGQHHRLFFHGELRVFMVHLLPRYATILPSTYVRWPGGHINNLYNTAFWSLVQLGGLDNQNAEKTLAGTLAADKNEILFSRFHINYNNEPEIYKKGSVVFRDYELVDPGSHSVAAEMDDLAEPITQSKTQIEKDKKRRAKARVVVKHLDIIKDDFWDRRPWILSNKPGKAPKET
ncbi:tRNAHis guanylyltransferase [Metarhizium album ARSEF 1941]|uniref:tRNA(His) guanylyltransferase n=1 Tax=Metarhizium album (strain ARSEF 1941) TaxID=1081103 RepID=A0A0B2WV87_METAS|nr:tRNAHis guanylyltransferase [Metarhizium album ARSEF 1941]KHN96805.1 tRNAHis guanylyltransferase [Metarhizium album ARSEF 1941]